jgi:hypothetical protein
MSGAKRDIRVHYSQAFGTVWHCDAQVGMDYWNRVIMPVTSRWEHVTCANCLRQHAESGVPLSLILRIFDSLESM